MIDRSKLLLPLRRRTLVTATCVSVVAFSMLPLIAALIVLVAAISGVAISFIYFVFAVLGGLAFIVGIVMAVIGFLGEDGGPFCGGIVLAVLGKVLTCLAPELNLGSTVYRSIAAQAPIVINWYWEHRVHLWSWIPCALALLLATITFGLVLGFRYIPELLDKWRGHHVDCPTCHHRGRPKYTCSKCGAVEADLRPSVHGLLAARCTECGSGFPTIDGLGRHRLSRSCASCNTTLDNPLMGRLAVVHVVLAYAGSKRASQTSLHVVSGRLLYLHECQVEALTHWQSASSHVYLRYLDKLVVYGDVTSLRQMEPLLAGLLGSLERALRIDVAQGASSPKLVVIEMTNEPFSQVKGSTSDNLKIWSRSTRCQFTNLSEWKGTLTNKELALLA